MDGYTIQRFRGGFAVVWRDADGRRHRRQLAARDRLGAEAEARRRIAAGRQARGTLGALVPAYLETRRARGVVSVARMEAAWKALRPVWEEVSPDAIDEASCRRWAAAQAKSPATLRYELAFLASVCRWAAREGLIARVPAIWLPPVPPRRERHISRAQFERFMAAVQAPHVRLYAELGIATAGRPSAILGLRWQQIDFERGLIRLNPEGRAQTAKGRATVPMTERARRVLEAAWAARTCEWVIECGGRPVKSIKKAFSLASARSGVRVTPYALRHSAAVWMAESGVPMAEIAAYLGHSDQRTTFRHYARFSPDYLRKAAAALDW